MGTNQYHINITSGSHQIQAIWEIGEEPGGDLEGTVEVEDK